MRTFRRSESPFCLLFTMICLSALSLACSQPQPSQEVEASPANAVTAEEAPAGGNTDTIPNRSVFTGNYGSISEETGENYLLNVREENGKLMLDFRTGGTAAFSYGEKSIEETMKGKEYLLSTEDLDGNGALSFRFKCNPQGKATEVVVTWLDDPEMKPMVLKTE